MKHIKILGIFCFLLLLLNSVKGLAITPEYVVYQNIGNCTKVLSGKNIILKKGDFLNAKSLLNIPLNGKLIIICANYKAIQLDVRGRYMGKNLVQHCAKGNDSFTAKYFHFVWDELTHPHSSPEEEPEKYMKTAGAVTRGSDPVNLILNADTINYFNGALNIKFTPINETVTVNFYSKVKPKNVLFTKKNTGSLSFNDFANRQESPGIYYWQMNIASNKKSALHVLNLMDEQQYQEQIKNIIAKVIAINEAEKAFMTGFLLEQHYFLVEASKFYKKAVALNPNNKTYQSFNARF